jgi:hypothetical protein
MFSLAKSLENGIVCQRRTGNAKQFVIMQGDKIIKGPYKPERLNSLILKSRYLALWKADYRHGDDNHQGIAIIPQQVLTTEEGTFAVFPNVALGYPIEVEKERNQESFSKYPPYQVLVRNSLLKGNHALEQGNRTIFDQAFPLFLTYIYLFLLNAGDIHLVNTLVDIGDSPRGIPNSAAADSPISANANRKNKVYVIDFDEDRAEKEVDDELFYFSLNPAKKYREQWLEVVRPMYPKIIEKLAELDKQYFDSKMVERLELAIKLLSKNFPISPVPIGIGKGLMKYSGGIKGSLSYSGKPIDVLISGIQKYIRRGMLEKALLCGFELYRMTEQADDAKRIVTNLWNRLEVIAAEDMLNPALLLSILKNEDRSAGMLYAIIEQLVSSKKTRIMSWAWRAYCVPEGRDNFVKVGGKLDTALGEEDKQYLASLKSPYWREKDDTVVLGSNWAYLELFLLRLKNKDLNCFAWLWYYMESMKDKVITKKQSHGLGKGKRDNPMIYLWEMIGISCGPTPGSLMHAHLADWLAKSYFEASDFNKKPFLTVAVMIAFYGIGKEEIITLIPEKEKYVKYLTGAYESWNIDAYVVDKHTGDGKKMGKDRKTFAIEGSIVENQDPLYYNEVLHGVYKNS